jgi:hypothetical protein
MYHPARALLLGVGLLGASLLTTAKASATNSFPAELKRHWAIKKALPVSGLGCKLCHDNDVGGTPGAAPTQPFGKSVFKYNAQPYVDASLDSALDQIKARNVDSDHDGVSDYDELVRDGTNPNDPKSYYTPPPPPPVDAGGGGQGQGGETSTGNEAGQPSTPEPAVYSPPPGDLPPPFEHGCALTRESAHDGFGILLLAAVAVLGTRRARSRRT